MSGVTRASTGSPNLKQLQNKTFCLLLVNPYKDPTEVVVREMLLV